MSDRDYMDEAVEAAKSAGRLVSPTCNVCGVEYVEPYEGPCQEPLAPFDGSRTCCGTVATWPDAVSTAAIEAAEPFIRADERKRMEEGLLSDEAVDAALDKAMALNGVSVHRFSIRDGIEAALASLPSKSEAGGAA